jgi:hypothetical protein
MSLHIQIEDGEIEDFHKLLNRATNTWADAPKWVWMLEAKVQARITDLKLAKAEKPSEPGFYVSPAVDGY